MNFNRYVRRQVLGQDEPSAGARARFPREQGSSDSDGREGTQEVASYSGRHVAFDRVWSWPKPVQNPLPVYVGGNGERVLDRVLRYGDHWMPNRERSGRAEPSEAEPQCRVCGNPIRSRMLRR